MIFPLKLFPAIFLLIILSGCEKEKGHIERDGLIIYQEAKLSWVRNFNPLVPGGSARFPTSAGIYEPLFIYNSITGEYVPWLATGYEWSKGNTTLVLKIREGVTWSDKTPFTAEDVAYTFNLKKQYPALDTRASWEYLEKVESKPNNDVVFTFKRVFVPGFDAIAGQSIVAKHIWQKVDDPVKFSNPDPIGTGPFTEIVRFDKQIWELGKNPNYWQPGKPHVDKLVFPAYPGNEQVTLALLSGELDWAGAFIPAIERVFISKDPENHKYWFSITGHTTFLHTNTKDPILKDKRVRMAISHAIDRDLVVKVGMYDYTSPAHITGVSGKMSKWHSPKVKSYEDWTKFDIAKAKKLLDEAGYYENDDGKRYLKNGSPLNFEIIIVSGWSDWIRSAQVISQNLKSIGIYAKVKTYEFGTWISQMQKGNFQLAIGWGEKGPTPYPLYKGMMYSGYVKPIGEVADVNWHRYSNSSADSLIIKFEKTSNEEEKEQLIHEMQHLFIENAPSIPLFAEASWAECNTRYFTNFPSEDNPYGTLSPNYSPENLFVMLNVKGR